MEIVRTKLDGVVLIKPKLFTDNRGFFFESYNERALAGAGVGERFVQDNHSRSSKSVLRGLHYQIQQPQGKLVRVVVGEIFDVGVDLRQESPTFGNWVGEFLSAENKEMLWVPPGFAHGFLVMSECAEVLYKTTDYYAPQFERTICWDDPQIGIDWPLMASPELSEKDKQGKMLRDAEIYSSSVQVVR